MGSSYSVNTVDHDKGTRESSETAFLRPALKRPNLTIYVNTLAKRILLNGITTAGVEVDSGGRKYVLSARKEVVLSAGSFQSPQLLMVSGISPAATLKAHEIPIVPDRPGVGQNLWVRVSMGLQPRY